MKIRRNSFESTLFGRRSLVSFLFGKAYWKNGDRKYRLHINVVIAIDVMSIRGGMQSVNWETVIWSASVITNTMETNYCFLIATRQCRCKWLR